MHFKSIASAAFTTAAFLLAGAHGNARDGNDQFSASFSGFQEIGALNNSTGAILSPGHGALSLNIDKGNRIIKFTLTYSGLSAPVTQSHIHFGKRHVAGGVMVFFCSNLNNGPGGTQPCPSNGGTVSGTIAAASVVAIPAQNFLPAGNFDALVAAIESNTAYGNIHTVNFPAGEIRGQVLPKGRDDSDS
jgi:hypothetical protein